MLRLLYHLTDSPPFTVIKFTYTQLFIDDRVAKLALVPTHLPKIPYLTSPTSGTGGTNSPGGVTPYHGSLTHSLTYPT